MSDLVKCPHYQQSSLMMSLALDGLLDAGGQGKLQQHLADCPVCLAEWKAMRVVSTWLASSETVGPPLGFAVRVQRRLEEKDRTRKRAFRGLAVLTGSLSLAGVTVSAVVLAILGFVAWPWVRAQAAVQQGSNTVSQIASGLGLVGKGVTLFLKDTFVNYGFPVLLVVGLGLIVLSSVWVWLYTRRTGNGVARS